MKIIFDDGKEIEFDENEVSTLKDPRERIFKKDGIWYITKIINKDFAKWLDETKPMIIKEKKIPEKLEYWQGLNKVRNDCELDDLEYAIKYGNYNFEMFFDKINEMIDYLKSKGDNNE